MSLLRAVATIGGFTLISRIAGFIRDAMIAAALGAGGLSDAFFVALRLPNMFRTLFAEGAFSAAFVPVFAGKIATEGEAAAEAYAEEALAPLLAALFVITILAELAMPWLIPLIAAGFTGEAGQMSLATHLCRITFPYLLFISLVSLQGGILNSFNRFAATAATPILLNLFQIGAVILSWRGANAIEGLCWSVTLGGLAQFLWLVFSCRRVGIRLWLRWPRLTPAMRHLISVMLPGVFGAGITQINLLVSTNVASLLPAGSISYLQYADRLNQLPLAVIGIAVGSAILPTLSRHWRTGETAAAAETQNRALELALALTLPAAAALAVIAQPILAVLFQHGHFDAAATHATAGALAAYAWGLPAFVLVKVLAPAFFARGDTKTPVKIGAVSIGLNLILTLSLAWPLAHIGNAVATTAAGWANAAGLAWVLRRQGHLVLDRALRRRLPRLVLATALMALVLAGMETLLAPWFEAGLLARGLALAALIGSGLASFTAAAIALGVVDPALVQMLRRRGRVR